METYDRYGCMIFTIINPNQRKNESQIEGFSAPPLSVDDFGARKFKGEIKYD
jgi:hypothetical protein